MQARTALVVTVPLRFRWACVSPSVSLRVSLARRLSLHKDFGCVSAPRQVDLSRPKRLLTQSDIPWETEIRCRTAYSTRKRSQMMNSEHTTVPSGWPRSPNDTDPFDEITERYQRHQQYVDRTWRLTDISLLLATPTAIGIVAVIAGILSYEPIAVIAGIVLCVPFAIVRPRWAQAWRDADIALRNGDRAA